MSEGRELREPWLVRVRYGLGVKWRDRRDHPEERPRGRVRRWVFGPPEDGYEWERER